MGKQLKENIRWQQIANMIFDDDGKFNWYLFVTAITHLLPAMMPFLQDEMENIFDAVVKQFGRRTLCPEATTDDLKFVKGAEFNHICSGSPLPCNTLLAIIMQETQLNCDYITMLKGTDPQSWLTSPFEFSKLFLDERTRSKLTGFDDFDITAIGQLVRRIKRLKQTFDENGFSYLLDARNKAMHSPTLKMSETELKQNFDAILSFLSQEPLNGRSEVVQAILTIKKLLDAMNKAMPTPTLNMFEQELKQICDEILSFLSQEPLNGRSDVVQATLTIKKASSGDLSVLHDLLELLQGSLSEAKRRFAHKRGIETDLEQMVKGTDPQKWLTSPFEFVRLFLEDWMRRDIHDFPECDVTALCGLVNSCMPLKNMFAPTNIDKMSTILRELKKPRAVKAAEKKV